MHHKLQLIAMSLLLFSAAGWAQQSPLIGTWKLNVVRSRYTGGVIPKNIVHKFELSGANGVKFVSDRESQAGVKTRLEFTANFDGKAYPYKGNEERDSVVITRLDPYTYQLSYKKGGETLQINYWVVSKDGKTLTTISTGVTPDNYVYSREVVFDKQ